METETELAPLQVNGEDVAPTKEAIMKAAGTAMKKGVQYARTPARARVCLCLCLCLWLCVCAGQGVHAMHMVWACRPRHLTRVA